MTESAHESRSLFRSWRRLDFWKKVVIGMLLGVLVGAFLGERAQIFEPFGNLFINAIKMLIVPLVFCSLISAITSMHDTTKLSRVGGKAIAIYLTTTGIAVTLGLTFGAYFAPGEGMQMVGVGDMPTSSHEAPSFIDMIMGLIPSNPVAAMANGNILQIIVFAVGLGISLNLIGDKGKPAIDVINSLAEAMYRFTAIVMGFAPYGIFALMAWLTGQHGLELLLDMIKVIGVVYVALLIQVLIVMTLAIKLIAKLNPARFLKGVLEAATVSFTTASGSATLPVSMKCASENLGISREISSFSLPLGATLNMDGAAIYLGVCTLFLAQAYGITLGTADYVAIVLMSMLASIGSAGVPGSALVMMSLVLTNARLPIEGLAIIAGIDRILDMGRTCVNVCGDLMVTTLIAKSENEIDLQVYNNPNNY
jgi:Na+/H+-dicarboxylate symporter